MEKNTGVIKKDVTTNKTAKISNSKIDEANNEATNSNDKLRQKECKENSNLDKYDDFNSITERVVSTGANYAYLKLQMVVAIGVLIVQYHTLEVHR